MGRRRSPNRVVELPGLWESPAAELPEHLGLRLPQFSELGADVVRVPLETGQALLQHAWVREDTLQTLQPAPSVPPGDGKANGPNGSDFGGAKEQTERKPAELWIHADGAFDRCLNILSERREGAFRTGELLMGELFVRSQRAEHAIEGVAGSKAVGAKRPCFTSGDECTSPLELLE